MASPFSLAVLLLNLTGSVFYETLRLYPPVTTIAKYAAEDTTFSTTATRPDGTYHPLQVSVPKNTMLGISIAGMHYNRQRLHAPIVYLRELRLLSALLGGRACVPARALPR